MLHICIISLDLTPNVHVFYKIIRELLITLVCNIGLVHGASAPIFAVDIFDELLLCALILIMCGCTYLFCHITSFKYPEVLAALITLLLLGLHNL